MTSNSFEAAGVATGSRSATAIAFLAICGFALLFRISLLDIAPVNDEYFHLLAAQGWNESGQPAILEGEYTRVFWFTRVVAWLFGVTGSSAVETGRILAVVAGVLIPGVLFLWLRMHVGWTAASIAAALAILWPEGIEEAQLLRFYSWQCLTFLVGAIAVFEATERQGSQRMTWAILALVSLGAALYLQITTAIGLAALLAWILAVLVLPPVWNHRARWPLLGGFALAGVAVLAALAWSGILSELWALYRWSAAWNAHRQNEVMYYHRYLESSYPVFWPLFPFAALLAFDRMPRLAAYCLLLFGVILVGQSFGGMKATRYLSFGMPFFFAILSIALAAILPAAAEAGRRAASYANPTRFRWVTAGLVGGTVVFALLVNPFFTQSLKALGGRPPSGRADVDWSPMPDLVGDWDDVPFRITTREFHTIAAIGDYDVLFSDIRLSDFGESEFTVDPRTGRPIVAEPETVAAILRCEPEGLLVGEGKWWQANKSEMLPLFDTAGRVIESRERRGLFAVHWSGGTADADACAALPL